MTLWVNIIELNTLFLSGERTASNLCRLYIACKVINDVLKVEQQNFNSRHDSWIDLSPWCKYDTNYSEALSSPSRSHTLPRTTACWCKLCAMLCAMLCANIYPSRLNHPIIPALILAMLITPAEFGWIIKVIRDKSAARWPWELRAFEFTWV